MTALHIAAEVGFALVILASGWVLWRAAKRAAWRRGYDAYHDGLPYNVHWGTNMCAGWLAAKVDHRRMMREQHKPG